jgi:serine/threonine protein kinase/tetratricopeptide (TPR) repeat protein
MLKDWDRVQALFEHAISLDPPERERFLEAECGRDMRLRREVETLLAADSEAEADIAGLLAENARLALAGDPAIGTLAGPWRIMCEVGRGGMGTVYVAERDDDEFRKRVAVKLVRRGMDTSDLLDRFRRERQILASLDHPYIAQLIDGGSTADGRPFLVMEYVEGEPIDEYCRNRDLGIEERLRLVLKVCEAVAHAHRNLVIHRDLKPRNVLITGVGTPKLLDFGMAKLLDPGAEGDLTGLLLPRPFTPDYASPEQVRGLPASTATDVYSLGAVLYELLTGARPHRIEGTGREDWERAICETPVAPPSAAASGPHAERLRRRLRGDLDNVVLMALRKDPDRRYASVDAFAADIRRYLDLLPVEARKDSLLYRASKFVRRHRLTVTAAALVACSMIAGTVAAVSQARKAETARRLAIEQSRRAEERNAEILDFSNRALSDVYALLENLRGAVPARSQLVHTTLGLLEKLSSDAGSNERLRVTLATAYLRLGDVQGNAEAPSMRDLEGALKTYRAGAGVLKPLLRRPALPRGVVPLWLDLERAIGSILTETGQEREAVATLESALETAAAPELAGDLEVAKRVNRIYIFLARAVQQGDARLALAYAERSLAGAQTLYQAAPEDLELAYEFSVAHTQVGYNMRSLGNLEDAEPHYVKSIALREDLVKQQPANAVYRRTLMLSYQHYASLLATPLDTNLGNPALAREYYRRARPLEERSQAEPNNNVARYDYATFLLTSAIVEPERGSSAKSLADLRKAAELFEASLKANPGILRNKRDLAAAHEFLGHRLLAAGSTAEAMDHYRRAIALDREIVTVLPNDRSGLIRGFSAERGLVRALVETDDRAAALAHVRQLIGEAEAAVARAADKDLLSGSVAEAYLCAASAYRAFGDWEQARRAAEETIRRARPLQNGRPHNSNAALLAEAQAILAECVVRLGPVH